MPMTSSRLLLSCGLAALACATPAFAQADAATFDIPAGPLNSALMLFARQAHVQILYEHALVADLQTRGLQGRFAPDEALRRLTDGAPLAAQRTAPGVFVLRRADPPAASAAPSPDSAAAAEVDTLVVTGTQIRGAAPASSPVTILTRDAMDRQGRATIADALSALPQNFGGVSTPQTVLLGTDGLGTNVGVATGVNLRGLGASSTLVLVNGRRMAGSGLKGDFADVSAIPTAAVDRVEVLLDGASAIYGSDAVGGVVNILLRRDFEGAETRVRYGGATQGGASDAMIGQTFGQSWNGGRALLSYELESKGRLKADARTVTADADLRALGGTDHRVPYAHPGNILEYDPISGAFAPAFAIPPNQNGQALTAADFLTQPNLENTRALADTLPEQTRHSLYLSLAQRLSPSIEASLDARYTRRDFRFALPESLSVFSVDRANPYYASPDGADSELIGYAFGDETGPIRNKGVSENFGATAGLTLSLPADWKLDLYADLAQDEDRLTSTNLINTGILNEALGASPDDPQTAYAPGRDGYFNPFGDGSANSRAVLAAIASGRSLSRTLSRVETLNAKADGRILTLPGGDLSVALGVQLRRESFRTSTFAVQNGADPYTDGGTTFRRSISAGFAELRIPVFGTPNARPGLRRLELSLAGRVESYDDVGLVGTPKIGALWSPAVGVSLRASYGRSFRAPGLTEVNAPEIIAPAFATRGTDQVLSLVRYGGNTSLRPETATTWTAGVDLKPTWAPGLTASFGVFDIRYRDRIGQPVLENFDSALSDRAYSPFVTLVDPANRPSDAATVQALLDRSTSASAGLFPATAYGAIIDARYVNAAELHVQGFDTALAYTRAFGPHRLDLDLDATRLDAYRRRITAEAAAENLAGQVGNPARLRLRATLGWSLHAYAASVSVNHLDGFRTAAGAPVDAWDTLDAQLSWRAPDSQGPFKGLSIALTAQNLLDAAPPFYDAANGVAYDPANADPLGRVLALQLQKRW